MARKRRGRGEGSVFERSDGQWVGSISLGYTEDGKRNRKVVYGAKKKVVLDELDRLRNDSRVGAIPDAGGMTVGQLLDRWLKSSESKTEARTVEERGRLIKNHLRPGLGGIRLSKLTALHVEGLYTDMRRLGVGASTIRHTADALGVALNYAVKPLKLIASSPADAVDKPKAPDREMLFLTPEQVKILLDVARDQHCYVLLVVALLSGCRQGELLGLTWEDVDLAKGTLTVRRSLAQADQGFMRVVTIIDIRSITKTDGNGVGMALGRSTGGLFSVVVACVRRLTAAPFPVASKRGAGTPIDDCGQAPSEPR